MRFLLRCLSYFRRDVPQILWSLLLIFLATLVSLLQPFPLALLIDSVFVQRPSDAWQHRLLLALIPSSKVGQIVGLAALTLVLTVVGGLLTMAQTMASVRVGYRGLTRVRCDLFRQLQRLSLAYHHSRPQGDAIYRLGTDTFAFQTLLNVFVGNLLVSSVMLGVMTWIMFSMNWRLAAISLAVVPLLTVAHQRSQKALVRKWGKAKEVETALTTTIQRSIASIWLTQAFGREEDEFGTFRRAVKDSASAMLRVHWREVIYGLWVASILGLGTSLIFGYGGYLVWRDQYGTRPLGEAGMTVGKLYVFITYLAQFYAPLNRLTGSGGTLAQAAVGARRVFEVLDSEPLIRDAADATPLPRQPRLLELRSVSFEYRLGEPVLRDISVRIPPGRMVGFVGPSGVGKSTLLSLFPRFYDPTAGSIRLDGTDARRVRIKDLRRHIALVLQDASLLPGTVGENIAYGRPDASDEEIREAAALAGAAEFIELLPDKYQSEVTENSTNLSGGQRQRLAIARALLTEAPILVLDEPTSALDAQNEQMIVETLRGLKRRRTIVLVSHRLSTVADCDEICVMDSGRIVERGTHDELLALRGAYYQMARHQLKLPDDPAEASGGWENGGVRPINGKAPNGALSDNKATGGNAPDRPAPEHPPRTGPSTGGVTRIE